MNQAHKPLDQAELAKMRKLQRRMPRGPIKSAFLRLINATEAICANTGFIQARAMSPAQIVEFKSAWDDINRAALSRMFIEPWTQKQADTFNRAGKAMGHPLYRDCAATQPAVDTSMDGVIGGPPPCLDS